MHIKNYLTQFLYLKDRDKGYTDKKIKNKRKDAEKVFRSRTTINSQNKLLPNKFLEGTKLTLMVSFNT